MLDILCPLLELRIEKSQQCCDMLSGTIIRLVGIAQVLKYQELLSFLVDITPTPSHVLLQRESIFSPHALVLLMLDTEFNTLAWTSN